MRHGIEICSLLNSLGDCSHISLQTSLETKFSQTTLLYFTRNKILFNYTMSNNNTCIYNNHEQKIETI